MLFNDLKPLGLTVFLVVISVNIFYCDASSTDGQASELTDDSLRSENGQSAPDKRGGKFYQWAGKRGKFYQWAGKRASGMEPDDTESLEASIEKRGKFYQWAGKRAMDIASRPLKKAQKFYAWAGKKRSAPLLSDSATEDLSMGDRELQKRGKGKFYQWAG